jgi:hypothetical protein
MRRITLIYTKKEMMGFRHLVYYQHLSRLFACSPQKKRGGYRFYPAAFGQLNWIQLLCKFILNS